MPKCKPTLWSQDKLDRSIFRVLEGDDGEETDLSETSGTAVKKKNRHHISDHINKYGSYVLYFSNDQIKYDIDLRLLLSTVL